MPKKLIGQRGTGFAIFNHHGTPWSVQVWATKKMAEEYLHQQRDLFAREKWGDLSRHSVQPVKVTISPLANGTKTDHECAASRVAGGNP